MQTLVVEHKQEVAYSVKCEIRYTSASKRKNV